MLLDLAIVQILLDWRNKKRNRRFPSFDCGARNRSINKGRRIGAMIGEMYIQIHRVGGRHNTQSVNELYCASVMSNLATLTLLIFPNDIFCVIEFNANP